MKFDSKIDKKALGDVLRPAATLGVVIALSILAGACMTYGKNEPAEPKKMDTGLIFPHDIHAKQGIDCTICHTPADDKSGKMAIPNHDVCSVCHDIPEKPMEAKDKTSCKKCHTRADYSVTPWKPRYSDDIKFSHTPHLDKKIECSKCHADPTKQALPSGNLMKFCINCHGQQPKPELTNCTTCHKTMNTNVKPKFMDGKRIPHDSPEIWKHIHGREANIDPNFCTMCHAKESFCEDCHRKTPPDDHTMSWRRKTHGIEATWNRQRCSVCHEEDSCLKCHKNTQPASHRGGWGFPTNRHCVTCHFPPERTKCTVCHEDIEHKGAIPSPHTLGIYPVNCALCHPGGLPHRAPHPMNSTVRCIVCHK